MAVIESRTLANRMRFRYNVGMFIDKNETLRTAIDHLFHYQAFNHSFSQSLIEVLLSNQSLQKPVNSKSIHQTMRHEDFQNNLIKRLVTAPILKKEKNLIKTLLDKGLTKVTHDQYVTNPFYQVVKPQVIKRGDWALTDDTYLPYQPVIMGDVQIDENQHFLELSPIGYFEQPFSFLALKQKGVTWMSITPFEINTMEKTLSKMSGQVTTLGLGLGYFAFMAALKKDVKDVTVIEKDQRVIDLFLEHIYPSLPVKDKITIVHADAFSYLKTNKKPIDHVFVDIYHTADDGLPLYMQLKKMESLWPKTSWHYWLESSILGLFRRHMIIYLEEQVQKPGLMDYSNPENFQEFLLQNLDEINAKTSLKNANQLKVWLSDESIKTIIKNLNDIPQDFIDIM